MFQRIEEHATRQFELDAVRLAAEGLLQGATPERLEGDFSDLLNLGAQYQIYDPMTRRSVGGGRFQSNPLPGNIIPAARISPIALNILKYYALPRQTGTADGINNLPLPTKTEDLDYFTHTVRVDNHVSSRHRIFGRVNAYKRLSNLNNWFDNAATGMWQTFLSRGVAFDDV